jgi:transitional endoplasmic reticulum ATPase
MSRELAVTNGRPDIDESVLAFMDQADEKLKERKAKVTTEAKAREAVTALLREIGGLTVSDDALTYSGTKFVLPSQYEGAGGLNRAIDYLVTQRQQMEQEFSFNRQFPYRPYDGAYAYDRVMRTLFGTGGHGQTNYTMFGEKILPTFVSVVTGPGETIQVPWGEVKLPIYQATFNLGYTDSEYGPVFYLNVEAPKKFRREIEAIFTMIEQELIRESLYRGKAITGEEFPTIIDPFTVDPDRIVYAKSVIDALEAELWILLTDTARMRELNIPLKRRVLLAGPYGTGKTLAGLWTAQKAVTNGWTFVQCRPGKDDPETVLQTAQLYAPAVVLIEDVDTFASDQSSKRDLTRLLEMLDGMSNKGKEVVALFTTNNLDKIQKGALRPGRIDSIIEITELDKDAFAKLVNVTLPTGLLADGIDWEAVADAFAGYLPAFAVEAIQRSTRYAFARTRGNVQEITTEDLIGGANSLRAHWKQQQEAPEGTGIATVDSLLSGVVEGVVNRTIITARGGEALKVKESK